MASKEFEQFSKNFVEINPIDPEQMRPGRILGSYGVPILKEGFCFPAPEIPEGYSGGSVTVGSVPGYLLTKDGVREDTALIYIHGGGFTEGSSCECLDMIRYLVDQVNAACYSIEYRLAPYHPFPTGLNDCITFYKSIREDLGYQKVIVGGGSAGANLSLAMTLKLKDEGYMLPNAVWASSPPADLCYDQRNVYSRDIFTDLCEGVRETYAHGQDFKSPYISPIFGDFIGFPPLLIQVGGGESLAECCVALASRAAAANTEVLLHVGKDMPHDYPNPTAPYPEAINAAKEVTVFMNNVLDLN